MFTHTHSNSSTSPSQGSGSNVCQSSTKTQENVRNPHEGIQRGKPKRRSPTTQPNVTVANQFTVKLQRAPKASRKNTCISFIYHSCRTTPICEQGIQQFHSKQIQHLHNIQLHHAEEQTWSFDKMNEWSSRPQHYLESTSRSSIESSGEPPSKVLHSGVWMIPGVNIKNMFSSSHKRSFFSCHAN